jgi:hypothetical protein
LRFQRKRFLEIDQSEKRIACGGHVCTWIGTKLALFYRGPPIDAYYQVSVHLDKRFQRRRFFLSLPIRNKNCLWWPFLLMDRDKMSNLYRGLSIVASYQISVHLGKRFQRGRFFRNQPIRNKNGLWRPCLFTDRN